MNENIDLELYPQLKRLFWFNVSTRYVSKEDAYARYLAGEDYINVLKLTNDEILLMRSLDEQFPGQRLDTLYLSKLI